MKGFLSKEKMCGAYQYRHYFRSPIIDLQSCWVLDICQFSDTRMSPVIDLHWSVIARPLWKTLQHITLQHQCVDVSLNLAMDKNTAYLVLKLCTVGNGISVGTTGAVGAIALMKFVLWGQHTYFAPITL